MNSVTISKQHRLTAGAEMIRSYNESGMKLRDWLDQNNITRDKFYYWRRKLRDRSLDEFIQSNEAAHVEFIEMPMHQDVPETTPAAAASVNINGCKITVYDTASVSFIKKLTEACRYAE